MYRFGLSIVILVACCYVTPILASSKSGHIKLTKVSCETMDPKAVTFKKCVLEKNKDYGTVFNCHINLNKNFTNILINAKFLRKAGTKYAPFFYDDTFNFCDFVRNSKSHVVWGEVFKNVARFSNINHTCPYGHDLIIQNLGIHGDELKLVPLPRGDYIIQVQAGDNSIFQAKGQVFFSRL